MSKKPKIRIALIGLGRIAQKAYLPILANHPKVDPILCTRNTYTLKTLSNQFRINNTCSTIDDLILSKPDAAMVHSSTESHALILSKLLNAKIPVFVDKPLSYSLDESEKILDLAAKYRLPLYLGFNRRFAPLIKSISKVPDPIQISWDKNRVNLAGNPRIFIFDDFIHVIDSLRFLGKGAVQNLNVISRVKDEKLENLQVQWQQGETLLLGGMNRVSGITEERINLFSEGNKWMINNLNSGYHFTKEEENPLKFDNWESTLYKRGFVNMIEDWINVLEERRYDPEAMEDIWATHQLCETILNKVSQS
ncbi:MAG: Gfo/Idh/MocA family oxidoreductase [Salegentibacter sp.]|uniref:Gfo/Idh/MocA family protein n=1 Tax=Salegentibacter sp. TaxID=1903072 RepID=UPI00286FDFC7|nr:Gfo/Idh/MocA family oxidoreductase [Salegentibacter sp.]MDR9457595.1 Gfo/Idh/MocA family oxidoreductase [Salegentibacter sp.]